MAGGRVQVSIVRRTSRAGVVRAGVIGALLVSGSSASCSSTPTSPIPKGPKPPLSARPQASAAPTAQAAAPPEEAPTPSPFSLVVRSLSLSFEAYPFPGGAMIVARSFLAVVLGDEVRQDPAFLTGLPEIINWDASTGLVMPLNGARPKSFELPDGLGFSVHAGNRHGPDDGLSWKGKSRSWTHASLPPDARLARLPRGGDNWPEVLALPSGHLFVFRGNKGAVEAFTFAPGKGAPTRQEVPMKEHDWTTATIAVVSPTELYFCTFLGELVGLRDGKWSSVAVPGGEPRSCAATPDGTLWVVGGSSSYSNLHRRPRGGDWEEIALPDEAEAEKVTAADGRVWVSSRSSSMGRYSLFSTAPVKSPIQIDVVQDPSAPLGGGITGFNQTSVDVPSVSADPPGPGTSACTSLVIYLGKSLTPDLDAALKKIPEAAGLELLQVDGTAPGETVVPGPSGAQTSLKPSGKKLPAVAAVPATFEQGLAVVEALAPDLPDAPPKLLCATPRITGRLGVVQKAPPAK
jgi:hypothetical protein